MATARLGKTVIEAEDLSVAVGPRALLDDVTWRLGPGERVGLIGPNGSGKSTLLNLLAAGGEVVGGEEPGRPVADEPGVSVTGEIIRGKTVRLGYLHQGDAGLDPALTPREAVTEVRGTLDSAQGAAAASQLLDRLGLRGDTQWTPARELSGGERRRLQLLRILVDEPNVLFLDEPTNDLDVDTLTELEDLLDGWPGSLVLVSHDRYFLERVTDHVVALLGDGSLSFLPGGVEEYLRLRVAAAGPGARPGTGPGILPGGSGTPPGATAATGGAGGQRAARKDMQRLERQIDRLTTQEHKLTAALAEHAADYVRLTELGAELRAVQDEKSQLEEQWLEAAENG
jgi:ATP-binding cassette subfamily F protein uup